MQEKSVITLTTDPEFRDLIPPLTEEEHRMLEKSILRDGCEQPLTVWNGIIVDGHNRYEICHKHNIPFAVVEKDFENRNAAIVWMLRNQLGRRNLNSFQRSELALRFEKMIAEHAHERQWAGKPVERVNDLNRISEKDTDKRSESADDLGQNSAQGTETRKTSHQLASLAGVSHDTIKKVKKLVENADEETKSDLRRGKMTINKAYNALMHREHAEEKRVCERCGQEKPVSEFGVPTNRGDFSRLCLDCEKEIKAAAKAAAEAASKTTETGGHCSIPGMVMHKGHPIHVETAPEDKPEMFAQVESLIRFAIRGYVDNMEEAFRWYTPGMRSEDNTRLLRSLIMDTNTQILTELDKRIQEEN